MPNKNCVECGKILCQDCAWESEYDPKLYCCSECMDEWSVLTFNEYQRQARKMAIYKDTRYLPFALIGEVGELSEHVAKMYRGDYAEINMDFCKRELGDILWMLANIASEYDIDTTFEFEQLPKADPVPLEQAIAALAMECATLVMHWSRGDMFYSVGLRASLNEFENVCGALGLIGSDVAQGNLNKLAERAERGVIKGDGDER